MKEWRAGFGLIRFVLGGEFDGGSSFALETHLDMPYFVEYS